MLIKGIISEVKKDSFKIRTEKGTVLVQGQIEQHMRGGSAEIEVEVEKGKVFLKNVKVLDGKGWVINYLQTFKGIGPKTAEKLYSRYGEKVVELMKDPQFASKYTKSDPQFEGWERVYGILRNAVGETRARKALEFIKQNREEFFKNPYVLLQLSGFGFKVVDPIALQYVKRDSPQRIKEFIRYYLQLEADRGHTFVYYSDLVSALRKETGVDVPVFPDEVEVDGDRVYLKSLRGVERFIADRIVELREVKPLGDRQVQTEIKLTPQQERAVELALKENLLVITGYAGTGKTTITKVIVEEIESRGLEVQLLAPTGKASKRLEEKTGRPASTIHRGLIEGITGDVIIVDEASMIDVFLAKKLLSETEGKRVIFVGDPAQLPPVNTGHFFRDLINSSTVPVVELTEVLRNAGGIEQNANRVRNGQFPKTEDNFYWYSRTDLVERLLRRAKEKSREIQILTGVYRGELGVNRLNQLAQDILNPENADREFCGFRLKDRVIHTGRNDYSHFVMNGDTGVVVDLTDRYIEVDFWDGRRKVYTKEDVRNLQLAYALTVHKAQGSEWELTAVVFDTSSYVLLSRYWLYTALTRAKDRCFLLADKKAVAIAVKNSAYPERQTFLEEELRGSINRLWIRKTDKTL